MTQPTPPPVDPGNAMLAETPAQMTCALVDTPRGQRMAMTVRTASTTLTVLLARDDARAWGQQISNGSEQMSGLILAGVGALPVGGPETEVPR